MSDKYKNQVKDSIISGFLRREISIKILNLNLKVRAETKINPTKRK
jgi:hypothetical protein